jgi:hypothetical protein
MRKLITLTLSAALVGFAGAAGTPASAAPIGNAPMLTHRAETDASPFLDKVGWRHGHRGYGNGYRGYYRSYRYYDDYDYGYYPSYRSYGGYSPYYYSSPHYYGGPSIYLGFGGHRRHGHWGRW